MKTSRSFLTALTALSLTFCACVDGSKDSEDKTGAAGSAGAASDGGTGGDAGSAGEGTGATAGTAGTGGASTGGASTGGAGGTAGTGGAPMASVPTVDPDATPETKALFANLKDLAPQKTLIGMQYASTEGLFVKKPDGSLDWSLVDGVRSDIKDTAGKGPAVYGFDVAAVVGDYYLGSPDKDQNAKNARAQYTDHMKKIYARGGAITMSWHQANPTTTSDPSPKSGPHELWRIVPPSMCADVKAAAPDVTNCGANFDVFKAKVDVFADFLDNLKDDQGHPIPVIFRPFHENSGGWFWWGCNDNPTAKYHASLRAVWSWLVDYMKDTRKIHQLLWAISPNGKGQFGTRTPDQYVALLPGMDLVDVLGYDYYDTDLKFALPELRDIVDLAKQNDKIPAVTEGGTFNGSADGWSTDEWSKYIVGPIVNDDKARGVAWILFWYNAPKGSHWGPWATHQSAADFKAVCDRDDVLLEGDADLYSQP